MTLLSTTCRPGLRHGFRPERPQSAARSKLDEAIARQLKRLIARPLSFRRFGRSLRQIQHRQSQLPAPESQAWAQALRRLQQNLMQQGLTADGVLDCFATINRAVDHCFGFQLHAEQLFGGWVMLHRAVAEMQTGEGKTLTAALPAITMALAGVPVHVITVNDYLVERDAATLSPLYALFGLTVGTIVDTADETQRRKAYRAHITYGTGKQIVFDYLRDLQALKGHRYGLKSQLAGLLTEQDQQPVLRGLCFAIVDEADSILIDEARTPLILAAPRGDDKGGVAEAAVALAIARKLHEGADYRLQPASGSITLTRTGAGAVRQLAERLSGVWRFERYRMELIRQALRAEHLLKLDRDYLVRDGRIELIDANTGRTLPDRRLQHGLQRMLEVKEKLEVTDDTEVLAALSFQAFFPRYGALSGMSGTVQEVAGELSRVYDLAVASVPPHRPCRRQVQPVRVVPELEQYYDCLIETVRERHERGQPLLIGTRSVEQSERLSAGLKRAGLEHELLNARQDQDEAALVARAGHRGAITVATNMAGRGTDIPLGPGIAAFGGLHVLNVALNDSVRIDRQLFGRSARQGDPGSAQAVYYVDDDLLRQSLRPCQRRWLAFAVKRLGPLGAWLAARAVRRSQRIIERRQAAQREAVRNHYDSVRRQLSFSGRME